MHVLVLGAAAGGGFPQWNCNCPNCYHARQGSQDHVPCTQSSIALSVDGKQWLLCNASPDIRAQLNANPALWPSKLRGSGISGVLLVDAQIDHVTGLLSLREGCPWMCGVPPMCIATSPPDFHYSPCWSTGVGYAGSR